MASSLYTARLLSWQGLNPGHHVLLSINENTTGLTYVLRDISVYFGGPLADAPQSCVLIDMQADLGGPTVWGYDSGITNSDNPIYIHDSVSITSLYFPITFVGPVWKFANTSTVNQQVDVQMSGWILTGQPGRELLIPTLDG